MSPTASELFRTGQPTSARVSRRPRAALLVIFIGTLSVAKMELWEARRGA